MPAISAPCAPTQSRSTLIEDHLWLVRAIARKFLGRGLDEDQLQSAGQLGLVQAAHAYKPGDVPFRGYAGRRIEGAIKDAIRDEPHPIHLPEKRSIAERPAVFSPSPDAVLQLDDLAVDRVMVAGEPDPAIASLIRRTLAEMPGRDALALRLLSGLDGVTLPAEEACRLARVSPSRLPSIKDNFRAIHARLETTPMIAERLCSDCDRVLGKNGRCYGCSPSGGLARVAKKPDAPSAPAPKGPKAPKPKPKPVAAEATELLPESRKMIPSPAKIRAEAKAIEAVSEALEDLDSATAARVVSWFASRYIA